MCQFLSDALVKPMKTMSDKPNSKTATPGSPMVGNDSEELNSHAGIVSLGGEEFFKVADLDEIETFLVNVVSPSNHWMFVASNGGLTAGRCNADHALFPYYTQDKLYDLAHTTGSVSMLWVNRDDAEDPKFWKPFRNPNIYGSQRNLYKSVDCSKVIFEEVNEELGIRFAYRWAFSDRFGFVRTASLENLDSSEVRIRLLDGIQNILPYGTDSVFQNRFSNLADGYKKSELIPSERLGIYYLSSIPTDRAEPSEGLRATAVWSHGLDNAITLLSSTQIRAFEENGSIEEERDARGVRGGYLLEARLQLKPRDTHRWSIIADVDQDAAQIEALRKEIESDSISSALEEEIQKSSTNLVQKVAASDGLSITSDRTRDSRHYSNTLYNIMRGGIPVEGYFINLLGFCEYLSIRNRQILESLDKASLEIIQSSKPVLYSELVKWARENGNLHLLRIAVEYLPLTFSRRHGDPSRPWNIFSINTQDRLGNPIVGYQGNWRDIFQNWEALAQSYPDFLDGMIARFVNASTADGYNPYKISHKGIDWETLEPDSPWSNIGYWGDHQIVYLLRLLESLNEFHPDSLKENLRSSHYVYVQLPYLIRSFDEILEDPRQTIDYSDSLEGTLSRRCASIGEDGKTLHSPNGDIVRANLMEKLINPLLAKLSNFVPDGGIWMNTQRPEWNDANNALVGYGVSMVTLCYVHRYISFLLETLEGVAPDSEFQMNSEVLGFQRDLERTFVEFQDKLEAGFDPSERMSMMRRLGMAGTSYRETLYNSGLGGEKSDVSVQGLSAFLSLAQRFTENSIRSNRRSDGMYHSYNLLDLSGKSEVSLDRLSVMLEGQVAVLSSGLLTGDESVELLNSLRESDLYRKDVDSYLLYPDKELPTFLEKNVVCPEAVENNPALKEMLLRNDPRIFQMDVRGNYRFAGDFKNRADLRSELEKMKDEYVDLLSEDRMEEIESIFEDTFNHRQFTGRSGTFFAYEGLGSVYWHMVSKLVLAIQESWDDAREGESHPAAQDSLRQRYFETLVGLGLYRSPKDYGAFPTDAYSHTPKHAGAQQPGMTGQVKEDILTRFRELGLRVANGSISFDTGLLNKRLFLKELSRFQYFDIENNALSVDVAPGCLAFTFCQTLFRYRIGEEWNTQLILATGTPISLDSNTMPRDSSQSIFSRTGEVREVFVTVPESSLQ